MDQNNSDNYDLVQIEQEKLLKSKLNLNGIQKKFPIIKKDKQLFDSGEFFKHQEEIRKHHHDHEISNVSQHQYTKIDFFHEKQS